MTRSVRGQNEDASRFFTFFKEYDPTVEDSFRKIAIVDDMECVIDLWEITPHEENTAVSEQMMRTCQGAILIYSITSCASFDRVKSFRDDLLRLKESDKMPMVVVGHKCDLEHQRIVSKAEGEELARDFDVPHREASAKLNTGVLQAIDDLIREMRAHEACLPKAEAEKRCIVC